MQQLVHNDKLVHNTGYKTWENTPELLFKMQPNRNLFLPNCKHKYQNAKLYHYEQYN